MSVPELQTGELIINEAKKLREKDYIRYGMHIGEILEHCGCSVDDETRSSFSVLTQTTGRVDQLIDNTPSFGLRNEYRANILNILNGKANSYLPFSIDSEVQNFRQNMQNRGCLDGITQTVQHMFSLQEELRNTKNIDQYIELTLEEGKGLAELVLHVAGNKATDTAKRISHLIGPPANLFDHVFDAKRDYANGEIAFEPNKYFYQKALKVGIPKLVRVLGAYPNKLKGFVFFMQRAKCAWDTRKYMDPTYKSV